LALGLTFGEVRLLYVGVGYSVGNFAGDFAWEKLCAQGSRAHFTFADSFFDITLGSNKYSTLASGLSRTLSDAAVEVSSRIGVSGNCVALIVYIASHKEGLRFSDKDFSIIVNAFQRGSNGRVWSNWAG
jgi:hypothetical protein